MTTTAYLGLGSNVGDRRETLVRAIERLARTRGIDVIAVSAIRETAPVGDAEQGPFLNAVVAVETMCSARELLDIAFRIERRFGRVRQTTRRWGPRTLDIDLLLFGDLVIDEDGLRVPHPRLHERAFVLEPLAELGPHIRHPVMGRSIQWLWDTLRSADRVEDGVSNVESIGS